MKKNENHTILDIIFFFGNQDFFFGLSNSVTLARSWTISVACFVQVSTNISIMFD